MFSGIIRHIGTVNEYMLTDDGAKLGVVFPSDLYAECKIGDSIAVNGCCVSIVTTGSRSEISFKLGPQTVANTAPLRVAESVHLESSLRIGDKIGGHFVTGHVDGQTRLANRIVNQDCQLLEFVVTENFSPYLAARGSVAVNGVSLTIAKCSSSKFTVQLIPQTLQTSLLGKLEVGSLCNFEADWLARYVVNAMRYNNAADNGK